MREERGWTLRELAERTGIPGMNPDRLSKLERGNRNKKGYNPALIEGLAKAFGQDPKAFFLMAFDHAKASTRYEQENVLAPGLKDSASERLKRQHPTYYREIDLRRDLTCTISAPEPLTAEDLGGLIDYLMLQRNLLKKN